MLYSNTQGIGTDLVLLHGWGFNSALFSHLVDAYKNQYRITLIDLPGHGRSANVDGGLNEWCNEIIKILPNNPILLGWSLGGLLAINIANKIKISQLILLASTPKFIKDNDWNYGIDVNNFEQFSNTLQLDSTQGLKRFISLQTDNKAQLKSLKHSIDTLPASPNALAQGLAILLKSDLRKPLKQLTIPVQVILGERDTLVPIAIIKWYTMHNISITRLNTGHLPFLHPDFELSII
ncbi:alpha/beta fold hydrolase [bacterium endosymbiont of Bathymodiolus sp. 5 South]|jgi:pimeloyl-[acyl-carrier protein] methyl ester esterase|uniref:alpha/beta fold hydrolase n=1 Tax=bacterium endosymbiont of Bathymodiolus sp. 5 South TaxID=1181670 RepID=UPI0010B891EB|nr:alpha/beta fold hydrolase [bacterium endosymbiont of Bathymodiolus sp. 5 South]CAC9461625.1 Pimeloyl-[acyl-carrier protein] methyl ester esterase BioH (EC 3.1.1.85) [uncultured Gammaproteobacteria bacterium]CAC9648910.1 Pimeloyl-[acyl-carrier protein] methyl ester esterase BioH (EC 3.1.1.85) [uncultured Gammaproteobacteria bacterium]CAC9659468.1 Pimeloyl-[acyl-carrier protein] methyl ester esterase BioH (EC 3.1.1.85) [uncultured Gammaproteobacteria bacterium]SHN89207.1 Biotin synthesis prote